MKKLLLLISATCFAACGKDSNETKPQTPVEVTPSALSLNGFSPSLELLQTGCDFQKSFVQWFAEAHLKGVEVKDLECKDAALEEVNLPSKWNLLEGKCKNDSCTFYTFELTKGDRSTRLLGLLSREGEKVFGVINTADNVDYVIFSSMSKEDKGYYDRNLSRALTPEIPLISLTFTEAIQKALER